MKQLSISFLFLLFLFVVHAQPTTLSLDQCYELAKKNYPMVKQAALIQKSMEYTIDNLSKGFYPQVNVLAQATLQSDVTQLPIKLPNVNIPVLSKDQYRAYIEVIQPIYEGGVIKQLKNIQEANTNTELQKLEVELFKLNERINQLFFGILLIDKQLKQLELVKQDLSLAIKKMEAAYANGTALKSNIAQLKAELLKAEQKQTELSFSRKAYADMLGEFTAMSINENVLLLKPTTITTSQEIKRPELKLFELQDQLAGSQLQLLQAKNKPKVNFFIQGGFGRPAFNILSNNFDPYYIGGFKVNFPLSGFYTLNNEKSLVSINHQNLAIQKETFLFNTNFNLRQQNAETSKLTQLLGQDDEIIKLRTEIKNTAFVQLEQGIITTNDYIKELNAEDSAKQNKVLHEIQLLMAEYNIKYTTGN